MSNDTLIVIAVIFFAVLLAGREVTAWYFKTNELLKLLREINAKLDLPK